MTIAVLPALARPLLEPHLPQGIEARWFASKEEALALAPEAEIGWLDLANHQDIIDVIRAAAKLKWLSSIYAGVDWMPLDLMRERGVQLTNGAGINALTIAEYVVMGMLIVAKGYDDVVRARDRHEWLHESPGKLELAGTNALLLGAGAIGGLVKTRLEAFDVAVTTVRRTPGHGELGPNDWRQRLGEFDWIIIAVPATPDTDGMIGADEIAAMKSSAVIVNVARGTVIDQDALIDALKSHRIAAAFLDVMTPEPLPADHPLWSVPNAHLSLHLSGRAQNKMFMRAAERFIANLGRWAREEKLTNLVDLTLGY
jgi:phosphoglycerate dehydrogenase-like enzyme